jgi:hypothetical protein
MKKRRTSTTCRRATTSVLEARVISPRIFWYKCLGFLGGLAKLSFVLAAIAAVGWGIWQGVHKAFYQNPDFTLRAIDLNPNPVIDEAGLAEITGLDLASNLFEIDIENLEAKLSSLPAITEAHVDRHLPDTLVVRVSTRMPQAWIACPDAGIPVNRAAGGILADRSGVAYPCPELQLESAAKLPVIVLSGSPEHEIKVGEKISHPELRPCLALLESSNRTDAEAARWIDTVRQANAWSLLLTTHEKTLATFGLRDHPRQIRRLREALGHAQRKGYTIDTINLIPKENVPITLRDVAPAPRAIPVPEPSPDERRAERRVQDLNSLLNRD